MPTLKRKDSAGSFNPMNLKREDSGGSFDVMVLKRKNSSGNWEVITRRYIDNWERGDLTPYNVSGESATKDFTVTQNATGAFQGDWYGHVDFNSNAGGGSVWAYSMPASGALPNYPVAGDTITAWVWYDSADAIAVTNYGLQNDTDSSPPGYHCWIRSGEFALRYSDAGGSHYMASTNFSQGTYSNEWLEMEIQWPAGGGDHTAILRDAAGNQIASITGGNRSDETDWADGGVGWRGGRTTIGAVNVRFDNSFIKPQ